VDDDGAAGPGGCGGSASATKSIQKAIDASNADDLILVCPGTYVGRLEVTGPRDGLTIRSTGKWAAVVQPGAPGEGKKVAPPIHVHDVDGVTLQWLKVVIPTSGDCGSTNTVVSADDADAIAIRGLLIRATGPDTQGDCRYGRAVAFSDSDDVLVSSNTFIDYDYAGVDATDSSATIDDNSFRYFHEDSAAGEAGRGVTASGGEYRITNNVIRTLSTGGVSTPGLESGVELRETGKTLIRDNRVSGARFGVLLFEVDGPTDILRNTIRGYAGTDGDGIHVESVGGQIRRNTVTGFRTGIYVQLSSGNTFRGNVATGNTDTDCRDQTSGLGTLGTANIWIDNVGDSDSPNGICTNDPV